MQASDVDVAAAFRIDFDPDYDDTRPTPLITGDQGEFKAKVATDNLTLVSGVTDNDVTRWVHVDQTGGIRLYNSYQDAVNGGKDNAVELIAPSGDQDIIVDVVNVNYDSIAQMRSWEITTQRETVDTTILGEEFRAFYDQGLVSGQGSITALWDYEYTECVDSFSSDSELANYFSQHIRFREGSKFKGMFLIVNDGDEAVWYEADCICTNVGMNFDWCGRYLNDSFTITGDMVEQGEPPSYLLLDGTTKSGDQILLSSRLVRLSLNSPSKLKRAPFLTVADKKI